MNNDSQKRNEIKCRVYFSETDSGNVVYFSNYMKYMEIGFCEWFRQYIVPLSELKKLNNIFMAVKKCDGNFKKSLRYDDEYIICTELSNIRNYSISFTVYIYKDQQIYFQGSITLVALNSITGNHMPLPENIVTKVRKIYENVID